jgi:predicted metal-dependent hydrolase
MEIEVVRSRRRTRSVSARFVDGVLRVSIPSGLSAADEARMVQEMTARVERERDACEIDLTERAERLAQRFRLPQPQSIRWVDNQRDRWGSCTPVDCTIRISNRIAGFPNWVIDYVVVHELAHLVEPGHGRAFKELEQRYPRAERAIGYLEAVGMVEGAGPRPASKEASRREAAVQPWDQLPLFG